jgi:hypothetical protein
MKSKFLNLIIISLTTSILLAPSSKAFGQSLGAGISQKEQQPLGFNADSRSFLGNSGIQMQAQLESSGATTNDSQETQSSQPKSAQPNTPVSNQLGGFFAAFVFIVYILAGIQYRRNRVHRTSILLQQIETLERIWNMKSY